MLTVSVAGSEQIPFSVMLELIVNEAEQKGARQENDLGKCSLVPLRITIPIASTTPNPRSEDAYTLTLSRSSPEVGVR
jgi:hypothetical protein